MKEKKTGSCHAGIWTRIPTSSSEKSAASKVGHAIATPFRFLKYPCLSFTLFEPYGAVFIMNIQRYIWGKIAQTSIQNHFALSPCLFTLGLYVGCSINGLVFFFAAFAEVQVTVLSVLNLPRQGFPATCPVGHCCVCNPRLFASEIVCDLPTYHKRRMNKMSPSLCTCCLETQNALWRHVEYGVCRICLWLVARQLRIPNR